VQAILLNSYGSPWSVRWYFVDRPLRRAESIDVQQQLKNTATLSICDTTAAAAAAAAAAATTSGEGETAERPAEPVAATQSA
jgi:hypothetical protein